MSEHTHKPGLCCGRSDAILAAPGAGGGARADKKGRGPDTAHRTRAKLDMFMLEQQEASSVPGKLLQSSHCFPSCGDGAWESSSFHHKNNPELSQQLPRPRSASRTLNRSSRVRCGRGRDAAPELSVRHREGRPLPLSSPRVWCPPAPGTTHPGSMEQGRGDNPQMRCAPLPDGSTSTHPEQLWHSSPGSSRPQRHPPHHDQPSQDTSDTAPLLKPRKQTRPGPLGARQADGPPRLSSISKMAKGLNTVSLVSSGSPV